MNVLSGIDSDSRIAIAEGIVKQFNDLILNRKIPLSLNREKIMTRLGEIKSKLMALKWSYKPLESILQSKELREIEIYAKDIFDSFPDKWEDTLTARGLEGKKSVALLNYMKNYFYRLRERLTTGLSNDYAKAIDILCGEILTIENIDNKNKKCLVTDGISRYFVVTNIEELKKGDVIPIAKLPPQIIYDILYEGMFVGTSKGIRKFSKEDVSKRPDLTNEELGQTRGILEQLYVSKK